MTRNKTKSLTPEENLLDITENLSPEKRLKVYFEFMANNGISADELERSYPLVYESLKANYILFFESCGKSQRNHWKIFYMQEEAWDYVFDSMMKGLEKLDVVVSRPKDERIGYLVNIYGNNVQDAFKAWCVWNKVPNRKEEEDDDVIQESEDPKNPKDIEKKLVDIEDYEWGNIADNTEDMSQKSEDMALAYHVISVAEKHLNGLEPLALFSRVLKLTPRDISEMIIARSYMEVFREVLADYAHLMSISHEGMFANCTQLNDRVLFVGVENREEKLGDELSRAYYRARIKLSNSELKVYKKHLYRKR